MGRQPVDIVVTWVDSTDPHWIRQYEETTGKQFKKSDRFTGNDADPETELKMCLYLIRRNLPWIRKVFVLTKENQVPKCIVDEIVVHHSDIQLGDVFNSLAIECRLHKIAGLSEKFIYLNDDIFVIKPLSYHDMFDTKGRPIVRFEKQFHRSEWVDSVNFTSEIIGGESNIALPHVPYVLTKSIMENAEQRLYSHWRRTERCPLRFQCREITPVFAATKLAVQNGDAIIPKSDPIKYIWLHKLTSILSVKYAIRDKNVMCFNHFTGSYDTLKEICLSEPYPRGEWIVVILVVFLGLLLLKYGT